MSAAASAFLASLHEAAERASATETNFRREAAERIRSLEQERAFAFRRLTVMRLVANAAVDAESEEIGVAAALAALRAKLGWSRDSEARSAVLSRFAPVAQAMIGTPGASAETLSKEIAQALADFESWYAATYAVPFWSLFEHEMAETPLVDF